MCGDHVCVCVCVSVWRPCLCVCVCVRYTRHLGWQRGQRHAALPTLPPGDEDAPCLPLSPWLLQQERGRTHTHTHRLSSLLMCHRGAGPTAALSPLLHTLCCNYKPAPRSTQKEPIMAISSLSCFKAACNSLTTLTLASVCSRRSPDVH